MIWIFHLMTISVLLGISKYRRNDDIFITSSFLYAIFVFGQRWMTGTDFPHYLNYYLIDFKVRESGYYIMQKFLAVNNLDFGILIFIVLLITVLNIYRFVKKIDRYVVLILFLYLISELFFTQLSQIRQFVAVSFFLNSFYFAYQKKYIRSGLNIVLGALFHNSIIFLIPFLFIRLKLDRMRTLFLLLLSSLLPFVNFSFILTLDIFSKYSHYIDSVFNVNLSFFHYIKFYIILVVMIVFVWYVKRFKNNRIEQMILNGLVFNMLLYGLSFQFAPMLRVSYYFKVFEFVFLAYYHKQLYNFSKSTIRIIVVMLFFGIYSGLAITDPYDITRYDFRPLRLFEDQTEEELREEINAFKENA